MANGRGVRGGQRGKGRAGGSAGRSGIIAAFFHVADLDAVCLCFG